MQPARDAAAALASLLASALASAELVAVAQAELVASVAREQAWLAEQAQASRPALASVRAPAWVAPVVAAPPVPVERDARVLESASPQAQAWLPAALEFSPAEQAALQSSQAPAQVAAGSVAHSPQQEPVAAPERGEPELPQRSVYPAQSA